MWSHFLSVKIVDFLISCQLIDADLVHDMFQHYYDEYHVMSSLLRISVLAI